MKSFTRAISSIIKSQPYQSGRYFDKDNIMVLNEFGDTFYYDKTTGDCTLRVNGISTVLPTGGEMTDEMLVSLNGQLINQKILLLNFVLEGEIHVTALATTEEWDGDANPNRMFNFAGTKPTLLLDDRYSANNDVDAVVFYCIEKNGRYFLAKRLFSENFDKEHLLFTIAKELYESPDRISFSFNTEYSGMYYIKKDDPVVTPPGPIACIPTNHAFTDDLMNFNLVDMVDVIYQFYAIIETSKGDRFFVRVADNVIPTEPVSMNVYVNSDQLVPVGITASTVISEVIDMDNISLTGFNEPFSNSDVYGLYTQFLMDLMFHCNVELLEIPRPEGLRLQVIKSITGLAQDSSIPDYYNEFSEMLVLHLYKDPYSFKFIHATPNDIQRYGIVNNINRRCINIIDYINGGNELEIQSCAVLDLQTDPNLDDVSAISCVDAPTEYTFGIQNIYDLPDTSGTLQITDTVTGTTKKYIFNRLNEFLSDYTRVFIRLTFPAFGASLVSGDDQFVIMTEAMDGDPDNYFHPLKIIIQMNSPDARFTNNGSTRLAFCLNVNRHYNRL